MTDLIFSMPSAELITTEFMKWSQKMQCFHVTTSVHTVPVPLLGARWVARYTVAAITSGYVQILLYYVDIWLSYINGLIILLSLIIFSTHVMNSHCSVQSLLFAMLSEECLWKLHSKMWDQYKTNIEYSVMWCNARKSLSSLCWLILHIFSFALHKICCAATFIQSFKTSYMLKVHLTVTEQH